MSERFWQNVDKTETCWIWTGPSFETHGNTYGSYSEGGRDQLAHRASYQFEYGEIPDGCVLDHLCRQGLCVRPSHLEAVPNVVNILRGNGAPAINARKTHCKRGHELTEENTYNRSSNRRACRECGNMFNARRRLKP